MNVWKPDPVNWGKLWSFTDVGGQFVCWSLTSLCHSNGHIETMPAREINPFTALTRIRSQFLRTQWSTSNHNEWTRLRIRPLSHRGWLRRRPVNQQNNWQTMHLNKAVKLWFVTGIISWGFNTSRKFSVWNQRNDNSLKTWNWSTQITNCNCT